MIGGWKFFNKYKLIFFVFGFVLIVLSLLVVTVWDKEEIAQRFEQRANGKTITSDEIDSYLFLLNKERFTESSKRSVRLFLANELKSYGYQITEQDTGEYINLLADKGNISSDYILVGAHYDTVPNTVGMDDNASGIAALLAIAKYNNNTNVRFVAFDGEEYNLSGSRYYAENMSLKPKLVISLETIGYYTKEADAQSVPSMYKFAFPILYRRLSENSFRGDFSAAVCTLDADKFCSAYEYFGKELGLEVYYLSIPPLPVGYVFKDLFRSDHTPFLLKGIPIVMISDTANFRNKNYHQPTDTIDTLNTDFIAKQANAILTAITHY